MRRLLFIVVAFILYGSLYPFHFDFGRTDTSPLWILLHAWPARIDRFAWRDAGVNVLLYFPLGLTALLALSRHVPRIAAALGAVLLGIGLSASIEMLQIFDSSRTCSLLDVVCNFAGTLCGVGAALVFRRKIRAMRHRPGDRGAAGGLLLACCWAGWQLYPFVPIFSRGRLRANFAHFLSSPFSPTEAYASAAEWFAFALVMRAVTSHMKTRWLVLAMCCLPLRLLIVERGLAPAELLGAALALLVWTYPADGTRLRGAAIALGLAVVLRELSPFAFSSEAHAMSWIPFSATLDSERQGAALVLFRKAFEYGALIWLLRAAGMRYWLAGTLVGGGLFLLEAAQRYLPNRQAELTDTVIAALLTCILWISQNARRERHIPVSQSGSMRTEDR